jgi:hypothetical protein
MKFAHTSLLGISLALLSGLAPSQAVAATQTVGGYSFKTIGQTPVSSAISIAPFTAGAPITLQSVKLYFDPSSKPAFGGQAGLNCGFGCQQIPPTAFTANGTPTFNFSGSNGSLTTDSSGLVTLDPNTATSSIVATSKGSFNASPTAGIPTSGNGALQAYFSGSPLISSYQTLYSAQSLPPGASIVWDGNTLPPTLFDPTTLEGQFYVQYNYSGHGAPVPGPLPILGAGAAFAYSRQIRKRIKQSV